MNQELTLFAVLITAFSTAGLAWYAYVGRKELIHRDKHEAFGDFVDHLSYYHDRRMNRLMCFAKPPCYYKVLSHLSEEDRKDLEEKYRDFVIFWQKVQTSSGVDQSRSKIEEMYKILSKY